LQGQQELREKLRRSGFAAPRLKHPPQVVPKVASVLYCPLASTEIGVGMLKSMAKEE